MVAHRKNVPTRKAHVPSTWFIVLTIMLCVGGAGSLGALVLDGDDEPSATPPSASPSISLSPEPTEKTEDPRPSTTTPKPAPTATTPTTATPEVAREAAVSVLNNSNIVGAAKAFSGKVTDAGWTLGGIGNWSGVIDGNTVYYPPGLQAQAELLAKDVDIDRVRPSIAPMRMDRLTVILSPRS
ncbi:LytR C-terminal domain-containing protein [Aeromicrobium sp. UC242_57]|uniref:LytR C-terminal domain-containing protein n=1 Tax=Aeromicrobium sp. UC242_57 TaxID=3374624 RepID=UPI00378ACE1F